MTEFNQTSLHKGEARSEPDDETGSIAARAASSQFHRIHRSQANRPPFSLMVFLERSIVRQTIHQWETLSMIRSILFWTLVSTALAASAAPSMAQEDNTSITVSYADLNLQTAAGETALEHRVRRAVYEVCGAADDRDLSDWFAQKKCRAEAFKDASAKMARALAAARAPAQFATLTASLRVGH